MALPFACDCENIPLALTEIPSVTCRPTIGQILRLWFVRAGEVLWDSVAPANNAPATITLDLITEAAGWATLFSAIDSTKVVKTPGIGGNPIITPGSAVTQGGGDNSTANGATIIRGVTPSTFTADFFDLTKEEIAAIRDLFCEKDLEVYMINNLGQIVYHEESNKQKGFTVVNVFLSEKANNGLNVADSNTITFTLEKGYDQYLAIATPESGFNTLTV